MKQLLFILFVFLSISVSAQKSDTVKLQPTLERTMLENLQKINQLKEQITELEKSNSRWYKVILETGKIDTTQIIEQQYLPGKMIFKLKPK